MAKVVPGAPVPAPAFIRMLARFADADPSPSRQSLADQLGQWIDWSRAVALSRALDGTPGAAADPQAPSASQSQSPGQPDAEECARIRASLARGIADTCSPAGAANRVAAPVAAPGVQSTAAPAIGSATMAATATTIATAYAPWRQHCLSMQRTMLAASARLRGQLRERLAGASPELARLADVDAVMEGALAPREQTLLANVPTLLGLHFERLRQAAEATAPADADTHMHSTHAAHASHVPWLARFQRDMQAVLLAELDLRFQPVDALLAALRPR